jgi:hypothetical protein
LKNEVMNLVVKLRTPSPSPLVIQNDMLKASTQWKALKNELMNLVVTVSVHIAVLACLDSSLPMFVLNDSENRPASLAKAS